MASADAIDYLSRDKRCHANRFLAWPMIGGEAEMGTEERAVGEKAVIGQRSEEHTSELQSR